LTAWATPGTRGNVNDPARTTERIIAIHFAAQLVLTLLLTASSYVVPPWSGAYAEVLLGFRSRMPTGIPPTLLHLTTPSVILLMVVNQALAILAIVRSSLPVSRRLLVGGSLLLALIGVLSFPGGSHDLELYHAHARMVQSGANPYLVSPLQAFGQALSKTMPWPEQLAPYGPLSIGVQALLVGRVGDPWTAALALKLFYALASVAFVWIMVSLPSIREAWKAAAAVTVGWSPLLILEFAGNGHADSLMGILCALAVVAFVRGRGILPWLLLGLASLVKIEALLFLPILAAASPHDQRWSLRWIASPGITVTVVLGGYLFFGGPQNALPGLREEASKALRSVPQLAGYISGVPAAGTAWSLRIVFLAAYAVCAWTIARGRSILAAAPLLYAIYLLLAKSFLQPWHGALLVYLLAVTRLYGRRAQLQDLIVGTWSISAVLGGYSYLIARRDLSPASQAASTAIMVAPVLLVLLGYWVLGLVRRGRERPCSPS